MVEAVVTFDYDAVQDDELTLKEGQIITNITVMEEGWWEGEVEGRRGLFPDNFVEVIKKDKPGSVKARAPSPPPATINGDSQEVLHREGSEKTKKLRAKVVYSYHPQNEDEISLAVDDIIDVTGQPEDGWWEGLLRGKKGMFPSNFVTVMEGNEETGSTDKIDGAVAKDEPPPLPSEPPKPKQPKIKGVGFGNIFAAGEVKLRKTPGNSPADHPKKEQLKSAGQNELAQKRLSLKKAEPVPTPVTANAEAKAKEDSKENKSETKKEEKKAVQADEAEEFEEIVKERAKVTFPYEAQHSDELELKEGDIVTVLDKEAGDSGWWFGEVDGRKGVFPDNFVTMLPPEKEKVKKKPPAPMPARPGSVPKAVPAETKSVPSKPMPTKPPPAPENSSNAQPRRPSADVLSNAPPPRKPNPIAAPKPPKKVLPIPPKKPVAKAKPPPPKPAIRPPEHVEAPPPVVLRRPQSDKKETPAEGGFEDIKTDSGQKLTHITLSRPKNANRRPPSVFGGQGVNLSEALPVENGTTVPPPRPKSSPIGPTVTANTQPQVNKGQTEPSPAPSPATSRPPSLVSDTVSHASNAQVEELKKEVKSLQDQLASVRSDFKKEVVNLMTELDEEKKHRMAMQVELDRIKKLVLESK